MTANDGGAKTLTIAAVNSGGGTGNITVDSDDALDIDADDVINIDAGGSLSLNGGAASDLTTTVGLLTLSGAGGVTATSTGGTLTLNGTGQLVNLNATGFTVADAGATAITSSLSSVTIGAETTLSLDAKDNTNLTVTANDAADKTTKAALDLLQCNITTASLPSLKANKDG